MIARCFSVIKGLLLVVAALSSGCMSSNNANRQLVLQQHPLVDRIWDTQQKQFVSRAQLLSASLAARYLLLGETHDNIVHHRHQAELIADLYQAKRKPSVHFEMIDDQQGQHLRQANYATADELIAYLDSTNAGWQYNAMYRPVIEQAMEAQFTILPANLDHGLIRKIFSEGETEIPPVVNELLQRVTLTAHQVQAMQQEIIEGHCNVMPEEMLAPMLLTQRVRDARMAQSLLRADSDIRVLIAGNGHTRTDRGVPLYIRSQDKQGRLVSIAFVEAEDGAFDVADYTGRWDNDRLPFDYVWFTPRYDRSDPCRGLEQRLKRQ